MISIDEMDNINDLIIELQARLSKNRLDKDLLIREAFVLWHVLVEGIDCESFTEEEISQLLKRNYEIYQTRFTDDADYNFIMGWMLNIAFWYFDISIKEEEGTRLLHKAYKSYPKNSLFKWAIRAELSLKDEEISNLKIDIAIRFDQLYSHETLIKEYFLRMINTPVR